MALFSPIDTLGFVLFDRVLVKTRKNITHRPVEKYKCKLTRNPLYGRKYHKI